MVETAVPATSKGNEEPVSGGAAPIPPPQEAAAAAAAKQSPIRVHFYLGPVCRSEIINPDLDFSVNKNEILAKFGIGMRLESEAEKASEYSKYLLKLKDGGLVEKNGVLFHDDRVLIIPREEFL